MRSSQFDKKRKARLSVVRIDTCRNACRRLRQSTRLASAFALRSQHSLTRLGHMRYC